MLAMRAVTVWALLASISVARDVPADLPDIEAMLSEAESTADAFHQQAAQMQAGANEDQRERIGQLRAVRDEYDEKLQRQVDQNLAAEKANDDIRQAISTLDMGNKNLYNEASLLKKRNRLLRNLLHALWPKMGIAKRFLVDALQKSNDSNATDLTVLKPTVAPPTLDNFLDIMKLEAGESQDQGKASLLQVSDSSVPSLRRAAKKDAPPKDMIDGLSNSLAMLEEAQEEGSLHLKANFLARFEAGKVKTESLRQEWTKLNQQLDEGQAKQQSLHTARKHLKEMSVELMNRINAFSTFLKKAGDSAGLSLAQDEQVNALIGQEKNEREHEESHEEKHEEKQEEKQEEKHEERHEEKQEQKHEEQPKIQL